MRLTFEGDGLRELSVTVPAASVRLLVPTPGADALVIPEWDGNEFLLPGGIRPILRTFTPLRVDNEAGRLDIEIVRHPGGAVSGWAQRVETGAPAAISGPGTGFEFPGGAEHLLVLADETALPAVTQLLEMAPDDLHVHAHVEVVSSDAVLDLAVGDSQTIDWHVTAGGATPGTELVAIAQSLEGVAETAHI